MKFIVVELTLYSLCWSQILRAYRLQTWWFSVLLLSIVADIMVNNRMNFSGSVGRGSGYSPVVPTGETLPNGVEIIKEIQTPKSLSLEKSDNMHSRECREGKSLPSHGW